MTTCTVLRNAMLRFLVDISAEESVGSAILLLLEAKSQLMKMPASSSTNLAKKFALVYYSADINALLITHATKVALRAIKIVKCDVSTLAVTKNAVAYAKTAKRNAEMLASILHALSGVGSCVTEKAVMSLARSF